MLTVNSNMIGGTCNNVTTLEHASPHLPQYSAQIPAIQITSDNTDSKNCGVKANGISHSNGITTNCDGIELPTRYARYLRKNPMYSSLLGSSGSTTILEEVHAVAVADETAPAAGSRVNDANTAIQWIRQEILKMKQQDRELMRQLLDLRAKIHQLGGAHINQFPSGSNISNWMSLEDASVSMGNERRHRHGGLFIIPPLQTRAVSMLSVSQPRNNLPTARNNRQLNNQVQGFFLSDDIHPWDSQCDYK